MSSIVSRKPTGGIGTLWHFRRKYFLLYHASRRGVSELLLRPHLYPADCITQADGGYRNDWSCFTTRASIVSRKPTGGYRNCCCLWPLAGCYCITQANGGVSELSTRSLSVIMHCITQADGGVSEPTSSYPVWLLYCITQADGGGVSERMKSCRPGRFQLYHASRRGVSEHICPISCAFHYCTPPPKSLRSQRKKSGDSRLAKIPAGRRIRGILRHS